MQKIPVTRDGKKGSDILIIHSDDVVKIESVKEKELVIHTANNKYYWAATLEAFEEWMYEEGFRLIDQMNVVNMNHVSEYDLKKGIVSLRPEHETQSKTASAAWIHKDHIINVMNMLEELKKLDKSTDPDEFQDDILESILAQEEDSRFARSYAMIQAIFEKKKAEKQLEQSEQRYKSLFRHNPDPICSFDRNGFCTSANPALFSMTGYTEEELLHKSIHHLIVPDQLERWHDYFADTLQGQTRHYEVTFLHKNGSYVELSILNVPIVVNGQFNGVYMIGKDISERKRAEEMLIRSEKLSIVGQLAAGVAHEIRNPLTSLKGFVQLMQNKVNGYDSYFEIMKDELERINFIVSEFLVIAKPQSVRYEAKDAMQILQNTIVLLSSQAMIHKVKLVTEEAQDNLAKINCDENQIKQVFINILNNSMDAMPDGGNIRMELLNYDHQHIMIRFTDEGCGIPEERIPRLGEPFYTTKEKGTGLGLMVTFKIIESHGGRMRIHSKVNEGTTVEIILPTAPGHSAQPKLQGN
ncbi:PAS domain S-box protein [Paenibacillus radicis (ex Xue et al. 2023)]|uniref:histidine kinase n=1 Tax=Paenibacillus radicis (ex Xue et al. 2023) TaxID=2972489 RepID=A0ABT1YLT3_9BACL|nr:PAS domain S-box protein [Paenibacillus radicis (ex Xue et al. 2023)]MCR8633359.1 PAS domain S-box protein [Paenibacillus radicis (ex Xue et al. 2023)]